ncbi:hypothetical protein DV736_g198, partial [Chaetothyriales sp. CBS 134916]
MAREPFFGLKGRSLTWGITLCTASCYLLYGYDQGIMGSIINTKYFLEAVGISVTDADTLSTVVSIYDVGCMAGCLTAAIVGGYLGRKKMIFVGCIVMCIGAAIQCSSYSVGQLIAGRVIAGLGNGFNTGSVPTWISETSKAKSRGQMVSTQMSIAAFGIVVAYWMNYGFFHLTGQIVWRFPIAFQIAFAIPTILMVPFLPESPRFNYAKGRHAEADEALAALKNAPVDSEFVQAEKKSILEAIELEDHLGEFSWKSVFWDTSGQKIHIRMGLVVLIQMLQELPGLNMVFYYSSFIFITIGIAQKTSLVLGGVASICFWLGSIFGIFLIDRVGRKNLLHAGTIPSLITYAIYIPMIKNGGQSQLWVAFAFTCVICFAYGYSWLPIPWVLGPELLPVRYRHVGAGLNAFSNWTFTFIIVKVGPIGLTNIHWRLYIIFLVFTICQLVVVWAFYPETKGLTLEEIDTLFVKDSNVVQQLTAKGQAVRNLEDKNGAVTSSSEDSSYAEKTA